MIDFIYIKDGVEKPVHCYTSWPEVTIEKYIQLVNEDDGTIETVCSILTGVPKADIMAIPATDFVLVAKACMFVFDKAALLGLCSVPAEYEDWYIGEHSWEKLEKAKKEMARIGPQPIIGEQLEGETMVEYIKDWTKGQDSINAAKEIVKIYTGKDISGKPITEVFGEVNFFLSSYISFMNGSSI